MIERPKILTLNLTDKANEELERKGYHIYKGHLGKIVDTHNQKYNFKYLLLNYNFPENAHEYDIVIVDFSNEEIIDYYQTNNTRLRNKSENDEYLICRYPQNLFDPRGLSAYAFVNHMNEILKKECLLLVIQGKKELIDYKVVKENGDYPIDKGSQKASIYEFIPHDHFYKNKFGSETQVIIEKKTICNFLEKYNDDFNYVNIFSHPIYWNEGKRVYDSNFHPLIINASREIISYAYFKNLLSTYIFPVLEDNANFILEFIQSIGPELHPKLFPFSTNAKWVQNEEYALPNQKKLLQEKANILKNFEKETRKKEQEIVVNSEKYGFLHELLTGTGDQLVVSVIRFLDWLGFESIIDTDSQSNTLKEEDIRVENEKGLLVIEVKGIGGTSKDSECNQISKIKYRRAKERKKFDVFGLYIVNHQRHIPARQRQNPPFSKQQQQDAIDDERGLLTTWQLFNLYFDIENNIITKEEARRSLYNYGLISFRPNGIILLGEIEEVFQRGKVFIIDLRGIQIETGSELFIEKNSRFSKLTIEELKIQNKFVSIANEGEVGIKGNIIVSKKSKVWIKTQ